MSLLDETRNKRKKNNPLAGIEIKKEKLEDTSTRIAGDTHSKLIALSQISVKNSKDLLTLAINKLIDELDEDDKKAFERFYLVNLEGKIDTLKRKGKY